MRGGGVLMAYVLRLSDRRCKYTAIIFLKPQQAGLSPSSEVRLRCRSRYRTAQGSLREGGNTWGYQLLFCGADVQCIPVMCLGKFLAQECPGLSHGRSSALWKLVKTMNVWFRVESKVQALECRKEVASDSQLCRTGLSLWDLCGSVPSRR